MPELAPAPAQSRVASDPNATSVASGGTEAHRLVEYLVRYSTACALLPVNGTRDPNCWKRLSD